MSTLTTYRLRDESAALLWERLAAASIGKARAYAFEAEGEKFFDEARVTLPRPEMLPGGPVIDPETGEAGPEEALVATGFWLCEVALVDGQDADLALD